MNRCYDVARTLASNPLLASDALVDSSTASPLGGTCFSLSIKAWASSARRDKLKHVLPKHGAVVSVAPKLKSAAHSEFA